MRIRQFLANARLTTLAEGDNYVIDFTEEGKVGAAIVIRNKNWRILEKGVRGDGSLAWMQVQIEDGLLGLASIHGPRERDRRKELWKWMEEKWTQGVCWLTTSECLGPHYTRQQKVTGRLDQARLDRIYFMASDRWMGKYTKEITRIEKEQEAEWRRWSRTKWLGHGEAPLKFYFQLLKAKRAKDEITCLKAENGDMLTSKEAIMRELHMYYTKLFKEEMLTDPDMRKLDEVLNLVDSKVTS
ncbi:hypothetical protein R1sor_011938 [Riccia sorocarpa]|uniref:Uncharacterized protein n=1 Tax=Riccia sorocarpa TaxID=122646 RepID=A0ABD3I2D1_9MARC